MNIKIIPEIKSVTINADAVKVALADYGLSQYYAEQVPVAAELIAAGAKAINLTYSDDMAKDEHTISVGSDSIEVVAGSAAAAYYAVCTLDQLAQLNDGMIETCEIHDAPDMVERAFSDDISRGVISTLDDFKQIIRRIAYIKGNIYMPYIEDSMEFESVPESGMYTDPVKKAEFKELVKYAAQYYVKIIPIINVLGHWDRNGKLSCFSDVMLHHGDDPNAAPANALDTRVPKAREMVKNILDEVIETFAPIDVIHVGGDEVIDYFRSLGRDKATELYCSHYKFVCDYLSSKGIKPLMYSDMFTPVWGDHELPFEAINDISTDVDFVFWDYAVRGFYKGIQQLKDNGSNFYVSPATMTYNRALPDYRLAWLNAKEMALQAGPKAKGMIMSSWGDGGLCFREENWYGNYAGANFAWRAYSTYDFHDSIASFFEIFYGVKVDVGKFIEMIDYDITMFYRRKPELSSHAYDSYNEMSHIGMQILNTLYGPCFKNMDAGIKSEAVGLHNLFRDSYEYFANLVPTRNTQTYGVFVFDIRRTLTSFEKINLLKASRYVYRDEAKADIPAILALADQCEKDLERAREVWFENNRQSSWNYYEARALDLVEGLRALARYCDNVKKFSEEKMLGRVY
ncbi:MAG: family 20 glycosylhydrolase [Clostridia bacterium]|nr:family 20 glycosylhydrolase [Clostridia bacterium]